MKIKSTLLLTSALLLGMFSCAPPAAETPPAPDMAQLKTEIQAMEDAYAAAENAKDADAVVAYYADDAVNMPNNEPEVVGKASILARVKEQMAKDTSGSTITFTVQDIMVGGDYLIEVGKSESTFPSGKKTTGKYISIFEKRDGQYVCIRDIWNNDAKEDTQGEEGSE